MSGPQRPPVPNPYDLLPAVPSFRVMSTDLADGGALARAQTADGGHISPHLAWDEVPPGTRSFVVTCFDPDAPTPSGFWHWTLVDLPADLRGLPTCAADTDLPGSAFHLANDAGLRGYYGAEPPEGDRPHRYYFVVHAVDRETLGVQPGDSPALASFELAYATVGRAVLLGTHGR